MSVQTEIIQAIKVYITKHGKEPTILLIGFDKLVALAKELNQPKMIVDKDGCIGKLQDKLSMYRLKHSRDVIEVV